MLLTTLKSDPQTKVNTSAVCFSSSYLHVDCRRHQKGAESQIRFGSRENGFTLKVPTQYADTAAECLNKQTACL